MAGTQNASRMNELQTCLWIESKRENFGDVQEVSAADEEPFSQPALVGN